MKNLKSAHIPSLLFAGLFALQACSSQQVAKVEEKREAAPASDQIQSSPLKEVASREMKVKSAVKLLDAQPTTPGPAMVAGRTNTMLTAVPEMYPPPQPGFNTESYSPQSENSFILTGNDPLSTFSIDVDTGSYANIRRFLTSGQKVPAGAVRIEEMLNYFHYDLRKPVNAPLAITAELGPCPWQTNHQIVRIGIQGKELARENIPASNLVFLVDVSGSMNQANKLPLVKQSLKLLTKELTAADRISLVVYAGSDRVVLPPTPGDKADIITKAIDDLHSGGSTHGSAGITSAYALAHQGFIPGGNNRIILASDGDFNVGITSRGELEKLIEREREKGVFLTVLGFGSGNYKDDTMELLADKGNGNYSYIDSLLEAKKVLVKERASTLFTIAKDVKLQIEFNPARVGAYRLLGYENRMLADEDFQDDKKDAGEVGAGHTVTALYELIPPGAKDLPTVSPLKYQKTVRNLGDNDETLTISLRYKEPDGKKSKDLSESLRDSQNSLAATSQDFRFSSAVAWFGMLLEDSPYLENRDYQQLIELARNSRGNDSDGLRSEFVKLVETAELMAP